SSTRRRWQSRSQDWSAGSPRCSTPFRRRAGTVPTGWKKRSMPRSPNSGSAHVSIAIESLPEPTEFGADAIEFLFAPNKGEALKPLAKIASGGETARLMLALKSVLAEGDRTPTLVFDEVDVGVGARSGQSVGEKLWSLANRHQVIVISHLAQIAAFAGAHFMIEKDIADGRTVSTVRRLEGGTRLDELAEMIDGKPVSP